MVCLEVDSFDEVRRNAFMGGLKQHGIDSRPYFCTMSSMPMYKQRPLPVAARKSQIGVNLPSYYDLTKLDVERIGLAVKEVLEETSQVKGSNVGSGRLESLSSLCLLSGAPPSDWFGEQGHRRASDGVADFDDQTRRHRARHTR